MEFMSKDKTTTNEEKTCPYCLTSHVVICVTYNYKPNHECSHICFGMAHV